jgi:hypothetical protein
MKYDQGWISHPHAMLCPDFTLRAWVLSQQKIKYTWKSHLQWYSVCDQQKYFSHPSSVICFLPTPATKLKLGLQIGARVLTVIHLDQSIYLPNQQQVLGFAVPSTSRSKLCVDVGPKPFCLAKLACFNFSLSNFNLQGHILSTCGVALCKMPYPARSIDHQNIIRRIQS